MLVAKDCLDLKLVKTAHAADDFIWVSGGDAVKLNSIGVGNYINLTISDNRACETVRYDHVANWPATSAPKQLPVIRDVGATGRKNFGVNSCAVADWSVTQLTEYIEQVACAASCIGDNTTAIASLSTSTSTGLSAVNSAVASLSTGVSSGLSTLQLSLTSLSTSTSTTAVSLSTGLSTANSAIASLSTAVNNKADLIDGLVPVYQLPSYVDDVLEYPNLASFPATGEAGKIYVDTSTNKTYRWSGMTYVELGGDYAVVAKDEGNVLTTVITELNFTGAGVTATNVGGLVTVNVPEPLLNGPVHGLTPPIAAPAPGASPFYVDDTLNETWLWNGAFWNLVQGHAVDVMGADGVISQDSPLLIYSYTVPRNALISLSGQVFMAVNQDPIAPYYTQTNVVFRRNGGLISMQSAHLDEGYSVGDGVRSSISYAVGGFLAGDIIELAVGMSAPQPGLSISVSSCSFQAMFQG